MLAQLTHQPWFIVAVWVMLAAIFVHRRIRARKSGRVLQFRKENLAYTTPGKPWVLKERKGRKDALVDLKGPNGAHFWIYGRAVPKDDFPDSRAGIDNRIAHLENVAESVQLLRREDIEVGGEEGALLETVVHEKAGVFHYTFVVVGKNGYNHELTLSQKEAKADAEFAERELPRLLAGYALLDGKRTSHGDEIAFEKQHVSKLYGWSFSAEKGAGWANWFDAWRSAPDAELALLHRDLASITIHALPVPHAAASFDALAAGALSFHGYDASAPTSHVVSDDARSPRSLVYAAERHNGAKATAARVLVVRAGTILLIVALETPAENEAKLDPLLERLRAGLTLPAGDAAPAPKAEKHSRSQRLASRIASFAGAWLVSQRREGEGLAMLEASLAREAKEPQVFGAALDTCMRAGRHDRALELLEQYGDQAAMRPAARLWRPLLLERAGRRDEALDAYAKLVATGAPDGAYFAWLRLLWHSGRKDEALARADERLRRGDPQVRIVLAELHEQDGAADKALALLDCGKTDCEIARASTLVRAGRCADAIAVLDALAARGVAESAQALVARAMAEAGQGWLRKAQETLQRAARLDPADPEIPGYIESVSRRLGEGSHHAVGNALEAVPIPAAFTADAEPAGATGEDVVVPLEVRALHVRAGNCVRQTTLRRMRPNTAAAAAGITTIELDFHPGREALFVHELVVRDPAGAVVGRSRVEDSYVVDAPPEPVATGAKRLVVPVPGLRAGHTLELRFTREEHPGDGRFWFRTESLSVPGPAARSVLLLSGALDGIEVQLGPGVVETRAGELRVFTAEAPPSEVEPNEPPSHGVRPVVLMGARGGSFEQVGREYLENIAAVLGEPSDRVVAKAVEICAGAASEDERAARLTRCVLRSVGYHGVGFGPRAWLPDAAERTLELGLGDCKGQSLLLHQLCRATGVASHLALISSDEEVDEALPDRGQFNHMIVYLPRVRGGWFVDPTQARLDPLSAPPSGLAGRKALVLDPATPRLVSVPLASDGEARVRLERAAKLDEAGEVLIDDVLTYSGLAAAAWRGVFSSIPSSARTLVFEQILNRSGGGAVVESLVVEELDEIERDLVVRVRMKVRNAGAAGLPGLDVIALCPPRLARRRLPFRQWTPFVLEHRTVLSAPAEQGFVPAPVARDRGESLFASWQTERSTDAESVTLAGAIRLTVGTYPAERWNEYRDCLVKAVDSMRVPFTRDERAAELRRGAA